jgi:hypothetical protein
MLFRKEAVVSKTSGCRVTDRSLFSAGGGGGDLCRGHHRIRMKKCYSVEIERNYEENV